MAAPRRAAGHEIKATQRAGGEARRVTDIFNDARQPQWSPDGRNIIFFGYRQGGYDLWEVAVDGSDLHQLTEGTFDDRVEALARADVAVLASDGLLAQAEVGHAWR